MVVLIAALLTLATPSLDTPAFSRCMDRAGGVTVEMRTCMSAEHERWDKRLNGAYQRLMATLASDDRLRLRAEERAWLAERQRVCDHAGDDEAGGTLQAVEIDACHLDRTQKRAAELERRR